MPEAHVSASTILPKRRRRYYRHSGFYVSTILSSRPRSRRFRADLLAHCGGEEAISTPRRILVDLAAAAAVLRGLTLGHPEKAPSGRWGPRSPRWGAPASEGSLPILDLVCDLLDAGARALLSAGTGAVTPGQPPRGCQHAAEEAGR
jgi:hypothetical protein